MSFTSLHFKTCWRLSWEWKIYMSDFSGSNTQRTSWILLSLPADFYVFQEKCIYKHFFIAFWDEFLKWEFLHYQFCDYHLKLKEFYSITVPTNMVEVEFCIMYQFSLMILEFYLFQEKKTAHNVAQDFIANLRESVIFSPLSAFLFRIWYQWQCVGPDLQSRHDMVSKQSQQNGSCINYLGKSLSMNFFTLLVHGSRKAQKSHLSFLGLIAPVLHWCGRKEIMPGGFRVNGINQNSQNGDSDFSCGLMLSVTFQVWQRAVLRPVIAGVGQSQTSGSM